MNQKTKKLVVSAVMLALGTILSLIKFSDLPFGGSVTLFSMLPIIIIGYMYGTPWGLLTGFTYALLQMFLGFSTVSKSFMDNSVINAIVMTLLDYILAFTVLGLGGVFRKCVKNDTVALILGIILCVALRYIVHFASGAIFYGQYAEWFFADIEDSAFASAAPELCRSIMSKYTGTGLACIYSVIYNATYMLPEFVITLIGAGAIMAVSPLRRIITGRKQSPAAPAASGTQGE